MNIYQKMSAITANAMASTVFSVLPGNSRPNAAAAIPQPRKANRKEYTIPFGIQFL